MVFRRLCSGAGLVLLVVASGGCGSLMSAATGRLSGNLTRALMDQDDLETVRQGAPAYLLLIDGLIEGAPEDTDLLLAGARLYSSYAAAFVDEPRRRQRLVDRARSYGWRALCSANRRTCGQWDAPFDRFAEVVDSLGPRDLAPLFGAGAAWASWIQANREDWNAIADKARVDEMMQRVVELDEGFQAGAAHLYLGVLDTLLPAALGGKPEQGREHFERAIALSQGKDLMPKVLLAREYARTVFDRDLHDRLLREVRDADPRQPGFTLTNVLAQQEATRLLEDADDYFLE